MSRKRFSYENRRYWYHLSTTLKRKEHCLKPRGNFEGLNRTPSEPEGKRICVAPSIAHCLAALPYCLSNNFTVYRTKSRIKAIKPNGVFDANVTKEGWLQTPTTFVKIGAINLEEIESGEKVDNVISEAASINEPTYSGKVLRWWKRIKFRRYLKRA